jgi:hypothetical protein
MKTIRLQTTQLTIGALLVAGLLLRGSLLEAQPVAHYPPGVEGLKAASLPPPGLYLRDYNYFFSADHANDGNGHIVTAANAKAFVYANVPRVLWITDQQLLGGFIGVDALLPLQYTEIKATPAPGVTFHDQTFGEGDFFLEATWSKHVQQFDFALAYGVWAPTGDFSKTSPTLAGSGYWTHMLTAGVTWYPDQEKQWALSALNRYEINHQQQDTHTTPGQAYTLEWGASRTFLKTLDVGAAGYYQQKVTEDSGTGANSTRGRVAAIGPEVSYFYPPLMIGASLRYAYQFLAEDRLQAHTIALTITKVF